MIAFRRIDDSGNEIIVVCNFVPVGREDYKIGVPFEGTYTLVFDSDAVAFGGGGSAAKKVKSTDFSMHGFEQSVSLTLPPLSVQYYKFTPKRTRTKKTTAATDISSQTQAAEKPKRGRAKKSDTPTVDAKPKRTRKTTSKKNEA